MNKRLGLLLRENKGRLMLDEYLETASQFLRLPSDSFELLSLQETDEYWRARPFSDEKYSDWRSNRTTEILSSEPPFFQNKKLGGMIMYRMFSERQRDIVCELLRQIFGHSSVQSIVLFHRYSDLCGAIKLDVDQLDFSLVGRLGLADWDLYCVSADLTNGMYLDFNRQSANGLWDLDFTYYYDITCWGSEWAEIAVSAVVELTANPSVSRQHKRSANLIDLRESKYSDFFSDRTGSQIKVLDEIESSYVFAKRVDRKAKHFFQLPDDNWVVRGMGQIIANYMNDYNRGELRAIAGVLLSKTGWELDSTIYFVCGNCTVLTCKWCCFLDAWDEFVEFDDECPILLSTEPDRRALVFAPNGDIHSIDPEREDRSD